MEFTEPTELTHATSRLTLQNIEEARTTERKEYEVKVVELTKKQEDLSQEISRYVVNTL